MQEWLTEWLQEFKKAEEQQEEGFLCVFKAEFL